MSLQKKTVTLQKVQYIYNGINNNHLHIRFTYSVEDMDIFTQEYRQIWRNTCCQKA